MKKNIKKILAYLERIVNKILPDNRILILRAWAGFSLSCVYNKKNYGDDLNIYILRNFSNCCILNSSSFRSKTENLCAIGSLIPWFTDTNSIIWGSGVVNPKIPLKAKPKKVLAVRGKLTRDYFIDNGINCPEIYGDPALLLPYIYQPKLPEKKNINMVLLHIGKMKKI